MFQNPTGHLFQRGWRDGFFDVGVLAGCSGLGGLEEMVQARKLVNLEILVAAGLKGLTDSRQVLCGRYLQIFFSIDRQNRASDLHERGAGS